MQFAFLQKQKAPNILVDYSQTKACLPRSPERKFLNVGFWRFGQKHPTWLLNPLCISVETR